MIALAHATPQAVREWSNNFLGLWPHRFDYITAPFPEPGEKPHWFTESRYPLSDRLIEQGGRLFGVRFSKTTHYCLIDIDSGSLYHPKHNSKAFDKLRAALESLGLNQSIVCTSSDSDGLHVYFPFEKPQHSWKLASALATALTSKGFKLKAGQLEVFPNTRNYSTTGEQSLFNAHRLPLQEPGSRLLNDALEPVFSSQERFVALWQRCAAQNDISKRRIERYLKSKKRVRHFVSQSADTFLNDLNAEIEAGWTDRGQTNRLLGRITMRCYIFHHVLAGGQPLSGKALIDEIIAVARTLPGYKIWCRHRHEIHKRAAEWARCIMNSHYFPYGTQHGKYKAVVRDLEVEATKSYNDLRAQEAQDRIKAAMEKLSSNGELPETITERMRALASYGVGGRTLYRYKQLWHPQFQSAQTTEEIEVEKSQLQSSRAEAPYDGGTSAQSKSLLGGDDGNSLSRESLGGFEGGSETEGVGNRVKALSHKAFCAEKVEQERLERIRAGHERQARRLAQYLLTDEPILIKAALDVVLHQPALLTFQPLAEAIHHAAAVDQVSLILGVLQLLLQARWTPEQILDDLRARFDFDSMAHLKHHHWLLWFDALGPHLSSP